MSWSYYDDSERRWRWTDDWRTEQDGPTPRHLLILADTTPAEMREYDENPGGWPTVHVYTLDPTGLGEGQPLAAAVHQATHTVHPTRAPWVRVLDDRELIEWLEAAQYVNAT